MLSLQMMLFNLAVYYEFQWRYSLAPPEFIKLGRRRTVNILTQIFGIPDLPISHSLFPYKEHIKQPRLRRHGAKTPQNIVFTLFHINFYHSYSISFKLIVKFTKLVNAFWRLILL